MELGKTHGAAAVCTHFETVEFEDQSENPLITPAAVKQVPS